MEITKELMATFVGGQLEIRHPRDRTTHRGEIASVELTKHALTVGFRWFAVLRNAEWYHASNLQWTVCLDQASFTDLGKNRILCNSEEVGEVCTFFPPGGSRVEPERIIGLQLNA